MQRKKKWITNVIREYALDEIGMFSTQNNEEIVSTFFFRVLDE